MHPSIQKYFNKLNFFAGVLVAFWLPLYDNLLPHALVFWLFTWFLEGNFKKRFSNIPPWFFALFATAFFTILIISVTYSDNFKEANKDIQTKMSLLILPLMFAGVNHLYRKNYKIILKAFIAGNLTAITICLVTATINSLNNPISNDFFNTTVFEDRLHYSFFRLIKEGYSYYSYTYLSALMHPTYFAIQLVLCIFFAGHLFNASFNKKSKIFYTFLIVLFVIFLVFLNSKAAIITLMIVAALNYIYKYIKSKNYFRISLIFITLLFLSLILLKYTRLNSIISSYTEYKNNNLSDSAMQNNSLSRLFLWKAAKEVGKENFVFGVGVGDTKDELIKKYLKYHKTEIAKSNYNAHNQYLETFMSVGIVGLIFFISMFYFPFILGFQSRNRLLMMFLGIIIINCVFESILNRLTGIAFFAYFYGFLIFCFPADYTYVTEKEQ